MVQYEWVHVAGTVDDDNTIAIVDKLCTDRWEVFNTAALVVSNQACVCYFLRREKKNE